MFHQFNLYTLTNLFFLLLIAGAPLALAEKGGEPTSTSTKSMKTPIKLALNWKAEPQFGGFYEAQFNHEFEKKGLQVEIIEGGSGTPTVQMLANEKIDFAIVSAEEIILSNDKNKTNPVLGVFAVYQTNPQGIMTHAERGFKTIDDVFANEGKIALQAGLSYVTYLKNKYGNVSTKTKSPDQKMKSEIVPYIGGIANFLKDPQFSQQCFVTSEPLLASKAGAKVKTFLVAESGFNPYTTVLAVRTKFLKDNEALVAKMVSAVRSGWLNYLDNPKSTNEKMAVINKGMDLDTFKKSANAQATLIKVSSISSNHGPSTTFPKQIGEMTSERWVEILSQLKELNLIKTSLKAEEQFKNF